MKLHQFLTKERWLQNQVACDVQGNIVLRPNDPRACAWCVVGAVEKFYPKPEPILLLLARQIVLVVGLRDPAEIVCDWNDSTTFEEVHAVLLKLDL